MPRALSVIAVLIAYLLGAFHCVLAELACQEIDRGACHTQVSSAPAQITEVGDEEGHFHHHDTVCEVEPTLLAPNASEGKNRAPVPRINEPPPAWVKCLIAALATVCALPQQHMSAWLEREHLPFIASGWQFMTRACAPARAP
ncbi:MAG: hypothetical protein LBD01_07195 [Puniceicoccales bacterium]|jgi:hypothetical protein|nr:hypothetical protein [Puniceicoccales bacterium]